MIGMLEIGIPNYIGNLAINNRDILKGIKILKDKGFNLIDVSVETLYDKDLQKIKEYAQENGLKYNLHAPIGDVNLGSFNKFVRKQSKESVKDSVDKACFLGSDLVTFHPGRYAWGIDINLQKTFYPREWLMKNLKSVLPEIIDYAKKRDVSLSVENCPIDKEIGRPEEIEKIISYGSGFTFDLFHACQSGIMENFVKPLGEKITLVHLSQNVNYKQIIKDLQEIGYKGDFILEVENLNQAEKEKKKIKNYLSLG